jgi:hypothetical protein
MKNKTSGTLFLVLVCGLFISSQNSLGQLAESKNKKAQVVYVPEKYSINKIDTVLNDSVKLSVRHITIMNSYASDYGDVTPDSIEFRYRDYAIEINLTNNGKEVVNKKLLKSDFISDSKYWKNLTLFKIWFESFDDKTEQIILRVGIGLPNKYDPVNSILIINLNGGTEIRLK